MLQCSAALHRIFNATLESFILKSSVLESRGHQRWEKVGDTWSTHVLLFESQPKHTDTSYTFLKNERNKACTILLSHNMLVVSFAFHVNRLFYTLHFGPVYMQICHWSQHASILFDKQQPKWAPYGSGPWQKGFKPNAHHGPNVDSPTPAAIFYWHQEINSLQLLIC